MISRHPAFRVRDCACLFSSGTRYQFQTDFIYAGLPTPSGFVSSTNLPFLLRTHTTKKTVTVRASFTSYLGFPFFLGFFFFFSLDDQQPFIPTDSHRESTPPRTDTPVREFSAHTTITHTSPRPNTPPSTPPHSVTPFLLVPACAAASSLGEYQRSSCPGGIQRGATRQAASVARFGGIQFRFFQHRPYATVVCPRTPYRDDVLAPLYSLQLTPDPHLEFGGHITVYTRPHIRRHTRALSSLFGDHPHTTSYLRNKHTHTIHTHTTAHTPSLPISPCRIVLSSNSCLATAIRFPSPHSPSTAAIGCRTYRPFRDS